MPSGDSTCKYCGHPIRWVVDEGGRKLPLNVVRVAGGCYRVVGADTARRLKKEERSAFGNLYEKHSCQQWKDAKEIIEREKADRAAKADQPAFPPNVVPYRNPAIIPPGRRR